MFEVGGGRFPVVGGFVHKHINAVVASRLSPARHHTTRSAASSRHLLAHSNDPPITTLLRSAIFFWSRSPTKGFQVCVEHGLLARASTYSTQSRSRSHPQRGAQAAAPRRASQQSTWDLHKLARSQTCFFSRQRCPVRIMRN